MAGILFITAADVGNIARLDVAGDPAAAADVNVVLTAEQPAIEAMLDPAALADGTATPLLQRSVAKLLAAEVLEMRGREEGASGSLTALGIAVAAGPDHAAALRAEAWAALAPYRRRTVGAVPLSADPKAALSQAQAEQAVSELLSGLVRAKVLGAAEARARLGLPAAPLAAVVTPGASGLTARAQRRLFGRAEAERVLCEER